MTLRFGFYDSINGDRKYDTKDFAGVFDSIMTEGVNRGFGSEFAMSRFSGRTVLVGIGRAWFRKTWSFNDEIIQLTLEPADVAQPRIDTLMLDIDTSSAVRSNTLRLVKGVAAANPVAAAPINTATRLQVALYTARIEANATTLAFDSIKKVIGLTPASPYSQMRLQNPMVDPGMMHRNTVRGKYLGPAYTPAQKEAVLNGSFDDLFVGDFWTINGIDWRIVDMDYYYHGRVPDGMPYEWNSRGQHHLVIMPDMSIGRGPMNSDENKRNNGAYEGADFRINGTLTNLYNVVAASFAEQHLYSWEDVISRGITDGRIDNSFWADNLRVELPSQIQIWGYDLFTPRSRGEDYGNGGNPPTMSTASTQQFALFRMTPLYIRATNPDPADRTYFLRDVISPYSWAVVESSGANGRGAAISKYGFRPYFCLS